MSNYRLPPEISRCAPQFCGRKERCLRYKAPLPQQYGSVSDFSLQMTLLGCQYFVPLSLSGVGDFKPQREVKPWPVAE